MQQLHPKAIWLFFFKSIINPFLVLESIFVFLAISIIFLSLPPSSGSLFFILLFSVIIFTAIIFIAGNYIWAKLSYKYYRYELREDGFRKELGVIWKKYTTIPYDRIQNVDIYRGVIDRILGLSELHIQTAGMSGFGQWGALSEGRLPGLLPETAEKLRDELIKRVRNSKGQNV